jgi:hypothetical protein
VRRTWSHAFGETDGQNQAVLGTTGDKVGNRTTDDSEDSIDIVKPTMTGAPTQPGQHRLEGR